MPESVDLLTSAGLLGGTLAVSAGLVAGTVGLVTGGWTGFVGCTAGLVVSAGLAVSAGLFSAGCLLLGGGAPKPPKSMASRSFSKLPFFSLASRDIATNTSFLPFDGFVVLDVEASGQLARSHNIS